MTCFLSYKGKILLLKRGSEVGSYRGKWAAVSGYIEDQPVKQAYKEIREETGLGMLDVDLKSEAESLSIVDEKLRVNWVIYPYLFEVNDPKKIRLDWEHVESRWVNPDEITVNETEAEKGKIAIEILGEIRRTKSQKRMPLSQPLDLVTLILPEEYTKIASELAEDIKAPMNIKEINIKSGKEIEVQLSGISS